MNGISTTELIRTMDFLAEVYRAPGDLYCMNAGYKWRPV